MLPLTLNKVSENKSSSIFRGGITYSAQFTDNPTFSVGNNPKIRTENLEIDDNYPVLLTNKFNIYNYKEIVQTTNNATLGRRTANLALLGSRDSNINDVKAYAITRLNGVIPSGTDVFLDKLTYNYSPIEENFSINASWTYQTGAYTGIY